MFNGLKAFLNKQPSQPSRAIESKEEKHEVQPIDNIDDQSFLDVGYVTTSNNKDKVYITPEMKAGIIQKHAARVLFVGVTSSGKTNLMVHMLKQPRLYGNYFDEIYLFSDSKDEAFADFNIPEKNIFDKPKEWDDEIEKLLSKQGKIIDDEGIHNSPRVLCIFEDVIHKRRWLRRQNNNKYVDFHIRGRHYNISIFTTTQSYKAIPLDARKQMDTVYYFRGPRAEDLAIVEAYTPTGYNYKDFANILADATHEKYSFLTIMNKQPIDRMFRKKLKDCYNI